MTELPLRQRRLAALLLSPIFALPLHISPAIAQSSSSTSLAPVVIVGTRHPRVATDVAGSVAVLDQEEIKQRQVIDLTDLVREEPGISIDAGGSRFNDGGFRIRGIGGNRVLTLIDNVPVADRFSVGSYADSGRDYLDLGLINRVEILRGPASVLYGSQALGGVVLMQTLSASDLLPKNSDKNSAYQLLSGYRSDRDARYIAGHGAWGDERSNFLIAMGARQQNERAPANPPAGIQSDRSDRERQSILLKQQSTLAANSTVTMTLDIDQLQQDTQLNTIIGIGRFSNTTDMYADDTQSRLRASIHHEWLPDDFTRVATRLYTQRSKTEQNTYETRLLETPPSWYARGFTYEQEVNGLGVDVQHDAVVFDMDHRIGVGIDLQSGTISQQRDGLKVNLNDGTQSNIILNETFPRRDFPLTNTLAAGIYANDEISLPGSSIVLIPGLRYDFQQLDSSDDMILQNGSAAVPLTDQQHDRVTGNFGMRWPFAQGWSLYAQYAQGFRAPPPSDVNLVLYYEMPTVTVTSLPSPNLKPETSDGYEIGINLDQPMYNVSVALFDNHYEDFIHSRTLVAIDTTTTPTTNVFQSINIDKARIYGAELRYRQKLAVLDDSLQDWSVELGAEWLRGINRTSDQPLNNVGPPKAVLALEWSPSDSRWAARSVNTFVRHHQRIDQSIAAQARRPYVIVEPSGYSVHDITADYSFARHWTLRAGIFNITDKSYYDWSAVANRSTTDPELPWLASSGRNASLSLQGKF